MQRAIRVVEYELRSFDARQKLTLFDKLDEFSRQRQQGRSPLPTFALGRKVERERIEQERRDAMSKFEAVILIVKVVTVKRDKDREPLAEINQYSRVSRILGAEK